MRGVGSNTQVSEPGGVEYVYILGAGDWSSYAGATEQVPFGYNKGYIKSVLSVLLQVPEPRTHSISTEPTAWAGVPMKRPDMMRQGVCGPDVLSRSHTTPIVFEENNYW
jgi:hypothetical protein